MNKKRIYIAGPMTSLPELNFPAFHAEAARLRALGHYVVNPAEINPDPAAKWEDCMREDIKALMDCATLTLLPGWEKSRGARLEHHIARELGMEITLAAGKSPFSPAQILRQPSDLGWIG